MSVAPLAGNLQHLNRSQAASRPKSGDTPIAQASGTLGKIHSTLSKIKAFAAAAEHSRPGELMHRLLTFVRNNPRTAAGLCVGVGLAVGALLCIATGPLGLLIGAAAGMAGFLAFNCMAHRDCGPASLDPSVPTTPAKQPPYPIWSDDPATSGAEYLEVVIPHPQAR